MADDDVKKPYLGISADQYLAIDEEGTYLRRVRKSGLWTRVWTVIKGWGGR